MKNLLIANSGMNIGGAERMIATLARCLSPKRYQVKICCLKSVGEIGDELRSEGHEVIELSPPQHGIQRYLSFLQLRRVIRDHKIDLIHSHDTFSLVNSSLVKLSSLGVKTLHTFHRGNYPNHIPRYMLMENIACRIPDRLVAVGIEQRELIRSTYRLSGKRILTIPNGIENVQMVASARWQERLEERNNRPVIGTLSTLIEQKGIPFLLEVARSLKEMGVDATFVIVGDGPLRNELQEKCKSLGLSDRVIFTGWMDKAANTMLPLFDVFFQPSLWEAMSLAVLEAMAASKPVVVTAVGDNRHVVQHGVTGFVVPPRDVNAMADALKRFIESPRLRAECGSAGQRRYKQYYTAHTMALQYENVYKEIFSEA